MFTLDFVAGFVIGGPVWIIAVFFFIHANAKLAGWVMAWLVKTVGEAKTAAAPIVADVKADAAKV
jgi:hypothetical protein